MHLLAALLAVFHIVASGRDCECDESADILFVQDLQLSMDRALRDVEDDIDDMMDEFSEIFRHPRFGVVTFKEYDRFGCVDVVHPLTRNEDAIEEIYKRLHARVPGPARGIGSPLAGLFAGLAWEDVEWRSDNRIIVLITNNMPASGSQHDIWPSRHSHECHIVLQPPQDLVLDYAKLSGTAILLVIPNAPEPVEEYWRRFNALLGQQSGLVITSSHDLDDWIERNTHFFRRLKAHNCFSDDFRISSTAAEAASKEHVHSVAPTTEATLPQAFDSLFTSGFPATFYSTSWLLPTDVRTRSVTKEILETELLSTPYMQLPQTLSTQQ